MSDLCQMEHDALGAKIFLLETKEQTYELI